ncbi:DUF2997 domain-containing protein, partial [Patescibacteria group bacterium]
DGEVQIEVLGFKGEACAKATAALEAALGLPVTRTKKPEYNTLAGVGVQQKVGAK